MHKGICLFSNLCPCEIVCTHANIHVFSHLKNNKTSSSTWAASKLLRWNRHIFPRAETALSYAMTLSEFNLLGCRITTSNLERASTERRTANAFRITTAYSNKWNYENANKATGNKRPECWSTKLCTYPYPVNSSLKSIKS